MRAFILRESVERNTNTYIHRLYAYIVQSESETESESEIVLQLPKHFSYSSLHFTVFTTTNWAIHKLTCFLL